MARDGYVYSHHHVAIGLGVPNIPTYLAELDVARTLAARLPTLSAAKGYKRVQFERTGSGNTAIISQMLCWPCSAV